MSTPDHTPKGFWEEVRFLDEQLSTTAARKQMPGLLKAGAVEEWWAYVTPLDDAPQEDYPYTQESKAYAIHWTGNDPSRLRSLTAPFMKPYKRGKLDIMESAINPEGSNDVEQMEYRTYTYLLRPHQLYRSMIATHLTFFYSSEASPPQLSPQDARDLMNEGHFDLTPEHYEIFLKEMRRGVSGEYRASLPPENPLL